ncbi:MAG TPA: rhodanese-like domain-containing protein [Streptosporangiaceae bacterium]|jgi:rhodanese-related sulfurtransferase|nr:rhodanese-like domain-containing protein [Streptosporangiaceae bacterium]
MFHNEDADTARDRGLGIMPTEIGRDELRTLTSQGAQLVEVLPEDEYEWAHLPGALNIPLKKLDEGAEQLDRSRPVIVYCNDTL